MLMILVGIMLSELLPCPQNSFRVSALLIIIILWQKENAIADDGAAIRPYGLYCMSETRSQQQNLTGSRLQNWFHSMQHQTEAPRYDVTFTSGRASRKSKPREVSSDHRG